MIGYSLQLIFSYILILVLCEAEKIGDIYLVVGFFAVLILLRCVWECCKSSEVCILEKDFKFKRERVIAKQNINC